jgi:2-dehydro-3-deoxygalactonokinase
LAQLGPFIAVDWGTTNRRAWRIAGDGAVEDSLADGAGITAVRPGGFVEEVARLRARLGDLPMLLGGMVGSNRGWVETPYVPCPAGHAEIGAAIFRIDARTGIVPGVCQRNGGAPEVMRGEEVQILGALASGAMPEDALVCLPGTHSKWVRVSGGRITRFGTWMTGEIFALLRAHSILAPQIEGDAQPGPGFARGLAAAEAGDPLSRLFRLRAAAALHAPLADGAGYLSGLLIGAEVRAGLATVPGTSPFIIGRSDLAALYVAAIAAAGQAATTIDGDAAFRAGARALQGALT